MANKQKASKNKLIVGTAILAVLIGSGLFYQLHVRKQDKSPLKLSETINYAPATQTEKQENEANKQKIVNDTPTQPPTDPTPGSTKKSVKPIITAADISSIRAYVPNIFEEGGTCTATFTQGSSVLTKGSSGFENVSYTQCAPINTEPGFLGDGSWSVSVKYTSTTAEGVSDSKQIKVQ